MTSRVRSAAAHTGLRVGREMYKSRLLVGVSHEMEREVHGTWVVLVVAGPCVHQHQVTTEDHRPQQGPELNLHHRHILALTSREPCLSSRNTPGKDEALMGQQYYIIRNVVTANPSQ